jgi:hypothetical protein
MMTSLLITYHYLLQKCMTLSTVCCICTTNINIECSFCVCVLQDWLGTCLVTSKMQYKCRHSADTHIQFQWCGTNSLMSVLTHSILNCWSVPQTTEIGCLSWALHDHHSLPAYHHCLWSTCSTSYSTHQHMHFTRLTSLFKKLNAVLFGWIHHLVIYLYAVL